MALLTSYHAGSEISNVCPEKSASGPVALSGAPAGMRSRKLKGVGLPAEQLLREPDGVHCAALMLFGLAAPR